MKQEFIFQGRQFDRLFPFYILINEDLQIAAIGKTLEKVFPHTSDKPFVDSYLVKRPELENPEFLSLQSLHSQLVVIECKNKQRTTLRGQIEFLPATNQLLFLGSPWFGAIEQVIENNLTLHDFAYHDPMIDLLHVLKTQEITTEDLKHLLKTINRQKKELQAANKEIHEIALFPTQNPDPLIRINLAGDVLRRNPTGEELKVFEYENKSFNVDDFFKFIAGQIDTNAERWIFEARSGNKDFSFVCKTIKNDGYVNIYGRDITQTKKDRQELERLSLIIQETHNAVIVTDAKGRVEWVNNAFEKVTGYTLEEVKAKTPGSVLQGKDTDPHTAGYMSEQIRLAKPFVCEIYNYKKSGEGYWLRINGQPIFDKYGKVTQFFAIEEDITKEKEAQEKLKQFDKRINVAMQKIGDNVWEHDFKTEYTSFSQQEFQLLGYTSEEFSSNVDLWYNCIYQDDKKLVADNDIKYRSGLIDHHSLEYRMVHKNGTIKWVLDRGVVIEKTPDGKPLKIIGTHTDITAQKEIEKELEATAGRLSTLIKNLYAGVLLENENRTIALLNKRFCEMFRIPVEPSDLIGTDCSQAAEQSKNFFKKPEEFIDRVELVLKQRKLVVGDQLELADGRFYERDFIPIWNEKKYEGHLWVYTDVTERIEAENTLKIAKKQTEELAQAKQNFLANMSHEIRTPMNAILGMSRQLQKTNLDDRQHFYLDSINNASENLLVIINDILDLSKIEAGKLTLEHIGFEPKLVVGKVMQVMMHKAEERGLLLTNSFCDSKLSPILLGDPFRLNQVLINLVSNAIKFTDEGTVDISCTVIRENQSHQEVQVNITDTGIGMEESFVENLFGKFTQEDDSVTRKYGGTGLGMNICKELVELMGGQIYVRSKKGAGTTVTFQIEFEKGTEADLPSKEILSVDTGTIRGKRVLVVDDNDMNRLVAATILKEYGAVIEEASNGEEALNVLRQNDFDLVLMDMQMPVMNGLEATIKIRKELGSNIPVVALTANAIKGENEKCFDAGMNDYITKPFEETYLLNVASRWLNPEMPALKKEVIQGKTSLLYDLTKLNAIAKGNQTFINKMVTLFIGQAPASVKEIQTAYHDKNFEMIKKLAHRLKPSIDNMGINSLKDEIREIEKNAEVYQTSEQLEKLLIKLGTVITEVVDDLRKLVK